MSGYPFLTLTGTARERGYQYGSQVPELIKKNIAFYRTMFEGFGVPWETAGKISKKFEPFIRDYYPEALEEISGVAEGANLSYEDILTIRFCLRNPTAARPSEFCRNNPATAILISVKLGTGSNRLATRRSFWKFMLKDSRRF